MSVATSTGSEPSLNCASARVRAAWLLLPWMAAESDAVLGQVLGELVGAVLGAGEHQRLEPLLFLDQVGEQFALLLLADQVDRLVDALGGGVARRDFHRGRVVQQALGELADLVREGGREQQVLALLRQQREHLADVADEAHVEHAVGFVQHQELDAGEVERALADVVEQAARGGDEDVDPLLQRADLRVDVDAAEHHQRGQRQVLAVGLAPTPPPGRRARAWGSGSGSAGGRAGADGCGSATRMCSSGSVKPAVLPVPVCAAASRSRPASTCGNGLGLDGAQPPGAHGLGISKFPAAVRVGRVGLLL
jgi:hypothetical protein